MALMTLRNSNIYWCQRILKYWHGHQFFHIGFKNTDIKWKLWSYKWPPLFVCSAIYMLPLYHLMDLFTILPVNSPVYDILARYMILQVYKWYKTIVFYCFICLDLCQKWPNKHVCICYLLLDIIMYYKMILHIAKWREEYNPKSTFNTAHNSNTTYHETVALRIYNFICDLCENISVSVAHI